MSNLKKRAVEKAALIFKQIHQEKAENWKIGDCQQTNYPDAEKGKGGPVKPDDGFFES